MFGALLLTLLLTTDITTTATATAAASAATGIGYRKNVFANFYCYLYDTTATTSEQLKIPRYKIVVQAVVGEVKNQVQSSSSSSSSK